jgi:hypothetical protein
MTCENMSAIIYIWRIILKKKNFFCKTSEIYKIHHFILYPFYREIVYIFANNNKKEKHRTMRKVENLRET